MRTLSFIINMCSMSSNVGAWGKWTWFCLSTHQSKNQNSPIKEARIILFYVCSSTATLLYSMHLLVFPNLKACILKLNKWVILYQLSSQMLSMSKRLTYHKWVLVDFFFSVVVVSLFIFFPLCLILKFARLKCFKPE